MGYGLAAGHLASLEFCHYFVPTTTNICAMLKDDANETGLVGSWNLPPFLAWLSPTK